MRTLLFTLTVVLLSCSGYESLTETKLPFVGSNLRLDGYYYSIGKDFPNGFNPDYVDVFILNYNGIYFNATHGSIDEDLDIDVIIEELDKKVQHRVDNIELFKESRSSWGVFSTANDSAIVVQNWHEAANGGAYPIRTLEGTIVNDTTIHFHKLLGAYPNNKGGKKKIKAIDETYHFRSFSPKPDSTVVFIK